MRRVHVKAGTISAKATVQASIDPLVRTRLVFHWAQVAIEQEQRALKGREQIERAFAAGEVIPLKAELQPAMIAIAACASALDALYAELAEHVGPETVAKWEEAGRGGRSAKIAAILELAVDADVEEWRPRLKTLFEEWRNPAIHPKAKARRPEKHPSLPANVPYEYTIYCVEAVKESVDLLLEIISACVDVPKPAIEAWANDTRVLVGPLKESHCKRVSMRAAESAHDCAFQVLLPYTIAVAPEAALESLRA